MKQINEIQKRYLDRALDILKECEPSMEHLDTFYAGPFPVLHVRYQGIKYIFKSALKIIDNELLPKEARILRDLKDVSGITHLVEKYGKKSEVRAILKEFFPGRCLADYEMFSDPRLQKKLEDTIDQIHKVGYTQLDIHAGNIILSNDMKDVCFIDPIQNDTLAETNKRKINNDRCMLRQLFY